MKAYRYVAAGAPLQSVVLPEPGWVALDVEVAALCHSDVHLVDGNVEPTLLRPPYTPGHDVAGTVCAAGEGVEEYAVGDRVAVAVFAHPEVQVQLTPGIGVDGGYAEALLVHASTLVPVSDDVSTVDAAVATDSVVTPTTRSALRPGQGRVT